MPTLSCERILYRLLNTLARRDCLPSAGTRNIREIHAESLRSALETNFAHHVGDRIYTISLHDATIPLGDIHCTTATQLCTLRISSILISVTGPQRSSIHKPWHRRGKSITIDVTVNRLTSGQQPKTVVIGPTESVTRVGLDADMFKIAVCLNNVAYFQTEECSTLIVKFVLKQRLPLTCHRIEYIPRIKVE